MSTFISPSLSSQVTQKSRHRKKKPSKHTQRASPLLAMETPEDLTTPTNIERFVLFANSVFHGKWKQGVQNVQYENQLEEAIEQTIAQKVAALSQYMIFATPSNLVEPPPGSEWLADAAWFALIKNIPKADTADTTVDNPAAFAAVLRAWAIHKNLKVTRVASVSFKDIIPGRVYSVLLDDKAYMLMRVSIVVLALPLKDIANSGDQRSFMEMQFPAIGEADLFEASGDVGEPPSKKLRLGPYTPAPSSTPKKPKKATKPESAPEPQPDAQALGTKEPETEKKEKETTPLTLPPAIQEEDDLPMEPQAGTEEPEKEKPVLLPEKKGKQKKRVVPELLSEGGAPPGATPKTPSEPQPEQPPTVGFPSRLESDAPSQSLEAATPMAVKSTETQPLRSASPIPMQVDDTPLVAPFAEEQTIEEESSVAPSALVAQIRHMAAKDKVEAYFDQPLGRDGNTSRGIAAADAPTTFDPLEPLVKYTRPPVDVNGETIFRIEGYVLLRFSKIDGYAEALVAQINALPPYARPLTGDDPDNLMPNEQAYPAMFHLPALRALRLEAQRYGAAVVSEFIEADQKMEQLLMDCWVAGKQDEDVIPLASKDSLSSKGTRVITALLNLSPQPMIVGIDDISYESTEDIINDNVEAGLYYETLSLSRDNKMEFLKRGIQVFQALLKKKIPVYLKDLRVLTTQKQKMPMAINDTKDAIAMNLTTNAYMKVAEQSELTSGIRDTDFYKRYKSLSKRVSDMDKADAFNLEAVIDRTRKDIFGVMTPMDIDPSEDTKTFVALAIEEIKKSEESYDTGVYPPGIMSTEESIYPVVALLDEYDFDARVDAHLDSGFDQYTLEALLAAEENYQISRKEVKLSSEILMEICVQANQLFEDEARRENIADAGEEIIKNAALKFERLAQKPLPEDKPVLRNNALVREFMANYQMVDTKHTELERKSKTAKAANKEAINDALQSIHKIMVAMRTDFKTYVHTIQLDGTAEDKAYEQRFSTYNLPKNLDDLLYIGIRRGRQPEAGEETEEDDLEEDDDSEGGEEYADSEGNEEMDDEGSNEGEGDNNLSYLQVPQGHILFLDTELSATEPFYDDGDQNLFVRFAWRVTAEDTSITSERALTAFRSLSYESSSSTLVSRVVGADDMDEDDEESTDITPTSTETLSKIAPWSDSWDNSFVDAANVAGQGWTLPRYTDLDRALFVPDIAWRSIGGKVIALEASENKQIDESSPRVTMLQMMLAQVDVMEDKDSDAMFREIQGYIRIAPEMSSKRAPNMVLSGKHLDPLLATSILYTPAVCTARMKMYRYFVDNILGFRDDKMHRDDVYVEQMLGEVWVCDTAHDVRSDWFRGGGLNLAETKPKDGIDMLFGAVLNITPSSGTSITTLNVIFNRGDYTPLPYVNGATTAMKGKAYRRMKMTLQPGQACFFNETQMRMYNVITADSDDKSSTKIFLTFQWRVCTSRCNSVQNRRHLVKGSMPVPLYPVSGDLSDHQQIWVNDNARDDLKTEEGGYTPKSIIDLYESMAANDERRERIRDKFKIKPYKDSDFYNKEKPLLADDELVVGTLTKTQLYLLRSHRILRKDEVPIHPGMWFHRTDIETRKPLDVFAFAMARATAVYKTAMFVNEAGRLQKPVPNAYTLENDAVKKETFDDKWKGSVVPDAQVLNYVDKKGTSARSRGGSGKSRTTTKDVVLEMYKQYDHADSLHDAQRLLEAAEVGIALLLSTHRFPRDDVRAIEEAFKDPNKRVDKKTSVMISKNNRELHALRIKVPTGLVYTIWGVKFDTVHRSMAYVQGVHEWVTEGKADFLEQALKGELKQVEPEWEKYLFGTLMLVADNPEIRTALKRTKGDGAWSKYIRVAHNNKNYSELMENFSGEGRNLGGKLWMVVRKHLDLSDVDVDVPQKPKPPAKKRESKVKGVPTQVPCKLCSKRPSSSTVSGFRIPGDLRTLFATEMTSWVEDKDQTLTKQQCAFVNELSKASNQPMEFVACMECMGTINEIKADMESEDAVRIELLNYVPYTKRGSAKSESVTLPAGIRDDDDDTPMNTAETSNEAHADNTETSRGSTTGDSMGNVHRLRLKSMWRNL